MFATAVPGLSPLVNRELAALPGVTVEGSGFDGRSDVAVFEAAPGSRGAVLALGLTEDVFVEVGRTLRAEGDRAAWIAGRIWRPERVQRALAVWADEVRPLSGSMTFRVIARVRQERSFLRTELRQRLTETIKRNRPSWRVADPAQIELWITEYAPRRCGERCAGRPLLRVGNDPRRGGRGGLERQGSGHRSRSGHGRPAQRPRRGRPGHASRWQGRPARSGGSPLRGS